MTNVQMKGQTRVLRAVLDQAVRGTLPSIPIFLREKDNDKDSDTPYVFKITRRQEDLLYGGGHLEGSVDLGDKIERPYWMEYTGQAYDAEGKHVLVKYNIMQ